MNWTLLVFVGYVAVLTLLAAIGDLRRGRIPNELSIVTLLSGLAFQTSAAGWLGLRNAALGATIGFGLLLLLWLVGGGGGGDVKFMAGLGSWLGPVMIVLVFVASAVLVAAAAVALGTVQRINKVRELPNLHQDGSQTGFNLARWRLPYAIPLSFATWGVLAWKVLPRLYH